MWILRTSPVSWSMSKRRPSIRSVLNRLGESREPREACEARDARDTRERGDPVGVTRGMTGLPRTGRGMLKPGGRDAEERPSLK